MSEARSIAVVDLGSARSKLLIAEHAADGSFHFKRQKAETASGGRLNADSAFPPDLLQELATVARQFVAAAAAGGCDAVVTLATESMRQASNQDALFQTLSPVLGGITIVNAAIEGALLYSAFSSAYALHDFCVADIGGGSVQVSWGPSISDVVSLPLGTFRLERDFQGTPPAPPTGSILEAMRSHIERVVIDILPVGLRRQRLVVGSNCMEEFLVSALRHEGLGAQVPPERPAQVDVNVVRALLASIQGRPYDELGAYYPANPKFMFGADKALLDATAIADRIHAKWLVPTDESVSTGVARLALTAPHALDQLGLSLHAL